MQTIVQEALKYTEKEKLLRESRQIEEMCEDFGDPQIVIVGCGGAGNNTINRLYNMGVRGAETIAIDTDKQHLDMIQADKKILVGKSLTMGFGAGGYPKTGRKAAELARGTLNEVLKGADLVFITAGMGGGTGTGTAPVVAEITKQQDAIVVGMVSSPFRVERARAIKAEEGLEVFRKAADTVLVLDNNRLLDYVPNLPIEQAFSVMDQLIAETVKGISEIIMKPSLINLNYLDVKSILRIGGHAVMLYGEARGPEKSEEVIKKALNCPLHNLDYNGATGCLIHITGGPDMTLLEAEEIVEKVTNELHNNANVLLSVRTTKEYEGKLCIIAIITGIHFNKKQSVYKFIKIIKNYYYAKLMK